MLQHSFLRSARIHIKQSFAMAMTANIKYRKRRHNLDQIQIMCQNGAAHDLDYLVQIYRVGILSFDLNVTVPIGICPQVSHSLFMLSLISI